MLRQLCKVALGVAVLSIGLAATAQAQHGSHHHGIGAGVYSRGVPSYGFSNNCYNYGYNNYAQPYSSFYGNIGNVGFGFNGYGRAPVWHNTTHYDYHPGMIVPHGNHYDYIPGHYDLHRSGHYHW